MTEPLFLALNGAFVLLLPIAWLLWRSAKKRAQRDAAAHAARQGAPTVLYHPSYNAAPLIETPLPHLPPHAAGAPAIASPAPVASPVPVAPQPPMHQPAAAPATEQATMAAPTPAQQQPVAPVGSHPQPPVPAPPETWRAPRPLADVIDPNVYETPHVNGHHHLPPPPPDPIGQTPVAEPAPSVDEIDIVLDVHGADRVWLVTRIVNELQGAGFSLTRSADADIILHDGESTACVTHNPGDQPGSADQIRLRLPRRQAALGLDAMLRALLVLGYTIDRTLNTEVHLTSAGDHAACVQLCPAGPNSATPSQAFAERNN